MPSIKTKQRHKATVWITIRQSVDVNISELQLEVGKKAATDAYIKDYAIGNRQGDGIVLDVEIERYSETISFYDTF